MTTQADYSPEEWKSILEGPPSAGMMVIMASRGGMFRETMAIAKAYAEARAAHGQSALLDEIVAAKPKADHTRYHSPQELRESVLQHLRTAVALLETRATAEEVEGYRRFVLAVADKVAAAHREHGQSVSPEEAVAIDQIATALGATAS